MSALLANAIFWIAAGFCVVAHVLIVRSVWVGAAAGRDSEPARRRLELAWALIPAIALGVVLVMTWRAVHATPAAAPAATQGVAVS